MARIATVHRYWAPVIRPLLDAARARVVVDVGRGYDELAREVARACEELGAQGHIIRDDPEPPDSYGPAVRLHRGGALRVLSALDRVDVALLHGHPNWHTITDVLGGLVEQAAANRRVAPVIVVGDVRWPFGRRDGYPDPDLVPAHLRHPAERRPVAPGCSRLDEGGLDPGMDVATHENGPRNGVRTAIDDFVGRRDHAWTVIDLPGFGGLAVLAAAETLAASPPVAALLAGLGGQPFLEDHCRRLELERLRATIALQQADGDDSALRAAQADAERAHRRLSEQVAQAAADHEEAVALLQRELDAARAARAEAETRATTLADELAEARRTAARTAAEEAEHRRTVDRLAAAERAQAVAEARLGVREQAANAMEQELRSSRRRLEEQVAAFEGERAELRVALATREQELTHTREARAELEGRLERLSRELAEAAAQADRMRATIDRESSARAALEREAASRAGELRAAREQERHLTGRLTELDADQTRAHRRIAEIEADLADRRREIARLAQERDTARAHVERARASSAWRIGHRTTRILRRITFRRTVHSTSALDEAIALLEPPPPQLPPARSTLGPNGSSPVHAPTNGTHTGVQ